MVQKHRPQAEAQKPTLDGEHLRYLAEESSTEAAESFSDNYAALLAQRVERIIRNVGVGNRDTAMDATLSLLTSSSMAGALQMSHLCAQLEKALVAADMAAAASVARDIDLHVPELQGALGGRRRPEP